MGQNVVLWLFSPQKTYAIMVESFLHDHFQDTSFRYFAGAAQLIQALKSQHLSPQSHFLLWIDFDHDTQPGLALLEKMMQTQLGKNNVLFKVYVLVPGVSADLKAPLLEYPCVQGLLNRNLLLTEISQVLQQQSYLHKKFCETENLKLGLESQSENSAF